MKSCLGAIRAKSRVQWTGDCSHALLHGYTLAVYSLGNFVTVPILPELCTFCVRGAIKLSPDSDNHDLTDERDPKIVYHGYNSSTVRKAKLFSLVFRCFSTPPGPAITFMTFPEVNEILKGAVVYSVLFLRASITAALHWFVSPYAHKL